jgi:putative flippase GtrA
VTAWRPTPRRRVQSFALIGLSATVVDLGLLLLLRDAGWSRWSANGVALTVAALWAYCLNRFVTFRRRPHSRWVRKPSRFALSAVSAGSVDMVVLASLVGLGSGLVPAKLAAIAAGAVVRWVAYRWLFFRRVRRELAERVDRPAVERPRRLTVVVPAFNEGRFIADTVAELNDTLSAEMPSSDFEIVVVDDGSADDTSRFAAEAGARVLTQPENRGKGAAVRAGALAAHGRAVVFTDADLAYQPQLVLSLLHEIEQGWDIVVGSRRHSQTDTVVRARRIREVGGSLINRLTHLVLLGRFRDTQCGIKGFRGDVATTLFERTRIDGFAFDVELFLMAEQDQLSLLEVPVSVENRAGSSVSLVRDGAQLIMDLVRIRGWAGDGLYLPNESQQEVLRARS